MKHLMVLTILAISTSPLTIFSSRTEAKNPRNLTQVWALQPTCGQNKFDLFGSGHVEVNDPINGYRKVSNDTTSTAIALFKQSDGNYLVGVNQTTTVSSESCFLSYRSGQWQDVSRQIIPNYSSKNYYEVARRGTTVTVFGLVRVADLDDEIYDKGSRKGSLTWRNGKFMVDR